MTSDGTSLYCLLRQGKRLGFPHILLLASGASSAPLQRSRTPGGNTHMPCGKQLTASSVLRSNAGRDKPLAASKIKCQFHEKALKFPPAPADCENSPSHDYPGNT